MSRKQVIALYFMITKVWKIMTQAHKNMLTHAVARPCSARIESGLCLSPILIQTVSPSEVVVALEVVTIVEVAESSVTWQQHPKQHEPSSLPQLADDAQPQSQLHPPRPGQVLGGAFVVCVGAKVVVIARVVAALVAAGITVEGEAAVTIVVGLGFVVTSVVAATNV